MYVRSSKCVTRLYNSQQRMVFCFFVPEEPSNYQVSVQHFGVVLDKHQETRISSVDSIWPSAFQPQIVRDAFGERLGSYVLVVEAWRRGLDVTIQDSRLRCFKISDSSGRSVSFTQTRPDLTTTEAHATAKNKHRSNQLLAAAGLPVPRSELIQPKNLTVDDLRQRAECIGYPLVIKPLKGAMGRGVFANIKSSDELIQRYRQLTEENPRSPLVLETHIPGEDYRVLVFGEKYIAACRRVPANITGDGASTVQELIDAKNARRRDNPFLSKGLIRPDHEVTDYLAARGYDYNSVVPTGENVRLRGAANASAGGDVVDVTEDLPQHLRDSAVAAMQAVPDLHCAGVDVLYDEQTGRFAFLELNSQPQIGVNMYPSHGTGADAPKKIIDSCFPDSQRSEDAADYQLNLNLRPLQNVVSSGHAAEIALPPLPASHYRYRRLYSFKEKPRLTPRLRRRILQASREHSVAGFIKERHGTPQLLASGSEAEVRQFISAIESITGNQLERPRRWKGTVAPGFVLPS